jgi:mycothiol maleylpyruvate isomerase-like protein
MTTMTNLSGTADALVLLDVAVEEFARRLRLVGPGDWPRPTPCTEWDVRALGSFVATADRMVACFHEDGALERVVHHVIGDRTGSELVSMRILDAAVHAWDLARAIGADERLHDEIVDFLLIYSRELDLGPQQSAFAMTYADVPPNASPQVRLLQRLGRSPNTEEIR